MDGLAILDICMFSSCHALSTYVLQVNQAVSDFSNERDKVVGQLREAEVVSTIFINTSHFTLYLHVLMVPAHNKL